MSGRSDQKERRMIMLQNMWTTFITEKSLFIKLFVEHIEISLIAILIAIVLGGVVGIEEVKPEQIMEVAKLACAPEDTMGNMPFEVTPEDLYAAIMGADALGRYYTE